MTLWTMSQICSIIYKIQHFRHTSTIVRCVSVLTSSKHTKVTSLHRIVSKNKTHRTKLSQEDLREGCRMGIDSHADTSCAGRHVRIMEHIDGLQYNVSPFTGPSLPNIGMINGIIAVDREDGQGGYILELNNALNFTNLMDHSLLCPMQARVNQVIIDDSPKMLVPTSSQSVIFPSGESIPIYFHGPIPFFHFRYPTKYDMDTYQWLSLTSSGSWEPYDTNFNIASIGVEQSHTNFDDYVFPSHYLPDDHIISGVRRGGAKSVLTPEMLSKLWRIPLSQARRTIQVTEQRSLRTQQGPISRRFRTDTYQRRYRRLGGPYSRFSTDVLFSKVKSTSGNTCAIIYSNKQGFIKIYPMESKSQAHETFSTFIHEVGIPHEIHADGAGELIKGEFRKKLNKYEVRSTVTEPYSPWQNDAERKIKAVKVLGRYFMQSTNTPIRLWDYAYQYAANVISRTAMNTIDPLHRTPYEHVMGHTPDISEFVSYEWFQLVWYWNPTDMQKQILGRWCGVADNIGTGHTYYILNINGKIVARSSVTCLTEDDLIENKDVIADFDRVIKDKLGTYTKAAQVKGEVYDDSNPYDDLIKGLSNDEDNIEFIDGEKCVPNAEEAEYNESISKEYGDKYLGLRVLLPNGDQMLEGTILSRKRTSDGEYLQGKANSNPLLDTRVYNVEFPDGSRDEYTVNMITESLYSSIDENGNTLSMISGIIDHRKDETALAKDQSMVEINGRKKRIATTRGWDMLVQWTDGSQSWIPLKDVKESNPLETAEYAVSRGIDTEPAFSWWVKHVQRTKDRIINRVRASKQVKHRIKFGIKVPNTVDEALSLDKDNSNDLWQKAIRKELDKVRVAFRLLDEGEPIPIGSKKINYHLIFEVKMDLTRKARLVAGGHLNKNVPRHTTYSSVVSRESVRICFTLAALNNLEVLSADIGNAYLNAKPLEKCHVTVTDDLLFGPAANGRTAIICRALYGMKSSGNAWRLHFANVLDKVLQFKQCYADNDVWYRPSMKPDGTKYYQYVCIYVDDILITSHNPKEAMSVIGEHFELKAGSVGPPSMYLGTDTKLRKDSQGYPQYWNLGANSYLKEALRIVKGILQKNGIKVGGKGVQPYSNLSYRPELDTSPFCSPDQHNLFQCLVGMLRWLIELGRIDVLLETSQLSLYSASPRIGHLHQALHIFHYLSKHNTSWIPMDPQRLDLEYKGPHDLAPNEKRRKMRSIYRDAIDEVPCNAPEPRGAAAQLNVYVDADHAGNKVTRRSQTGILIFLNMAPINWYSKKQTTVESSTFGSEMIALKIATEKIIGLRYKLRMMGVPLEGPANVFCDNDSVAKSSTNPEATLSKKNVSIAYHKCREAFAAGVMDIYFQYSEDNLADVFTKVLPVTKRKGIFACIFA